MRRDKENRPGQTGAVTIGGKRRRRISADYNTQRFDFALSLSIDRATVAAETAPDLLVRDAAEVLRRALTRRIPRRRTRRRR